MIKHIEIKTYKTCDINVTVKIDYDAEKISLVERNPNSDSGFKPKQWLFTDRSLEYTHTWKLIFEAMKYAVEKAEEDLNSYIENRRKEAEDEMCEVLDLATDMIKSKSKPMPAAKGKFWKK